MLVCLQAAMTAFHCIMQVFTSDHALKLDWIPKWIAIIGSGYIGLEFSDVYTALGSEVTFIEAGPPLRCIRQPHCCQADNYLHGKLCSHLYVFSALWCWQCTLVEPKLHQCCQDVHAQAVSYRQCIPTGNASSRVFLHSVLVAAITSA